jgi:catechol 2,3-dioxygenase-like lactoylglutathione lyase family enzyme
MEEQLSIAINHLQHVGIPVTSIKVSEAFYRRLGFENVMEAGFTQNGGQGTCIMMQHKTVVIELYQLPGSRLQSIRERTDGHIDHIAFDVDDIDSTFSVLKNAGFHIVEDAPVFLSFWEKGCRYFNIMGPDGERLEFNQVIR